MLTTQRAAEYLDQYIKLYRNEYDRFTEPTPLGGGYPRLGISPYLDSEKLYCYITADGVVLADYAWNKGYEWTASGAAVFELPAWTAALPTPKATLIHKVEGGPKIDIGIYNASWETVIQNLSFGAFQHVLDLHLPERTKQFWNPHIIKNIGLVTEDGKRRYIRYLELLRHSNGAAWEPRSAWMRANIDVRRDFTRAFREVDAQAKNGATIHIPSPNAEIETRVRDRLETLERAITEFENLLHDQPDEKESVFHNYLRSNPILLDVYGTTKSKPRFSYPNGSISPTGKSYVEPDFIIQYPADGTYRLIELERPNHLFDTTSGHPRVQVTHAAYQIAEWSHYIQNHYDLIREQFPGISSGYRSTIIISRSNESAFSKAQNLQEYIGIVRQQLNIDEVLTYDMLLDRAKIALSQLGK